MTLKQAFKLRCSPKSKTVQQRFQDDYYYLRFELLDYCDVCAVTMET